VTIENYSRFLSAFETAFPGSTPPRLQEIYTNDLGTMLDAIVRVKSHYLTKFHGDKAGLVIRAASGKKVKQRTTKRQRPCYPKRSV
jgi:hypothetical protein